ncbi:hypothetical protein SAMN05446935_7878 [Burkholderia sp. YR290]|nr:hypothetical protein SAMN05446935_7878 [Burkholderia sp. YR290]
MKFPVNNEIRLDDVPTIEHAMKTVDVDAKVNVDVDAKTVEVDSWLMPDEFFVAFEDEDYDVDILEAWRIGLWVKLGMLRNPLRHARSPV